MTPDRRRRGEPGRARVFKRYQMRGFTFILDLLLILIFPAFSVGLMEGTSREIPIFAFAVLGFSNLVLVVLVTVSLAERGLHMLRDPMNIKWVYWRLLTVAAFLGAIHALPATLAAIVAALLVITYALIVLVDIYKVPLAE